MATQETIQAVKQKAQEDFFHQRVAGLSRTFFPDSAIPEEFYLVLKKLLKFNSRKQMGVHPKTWENMCSKTREFFMPEIEVCFEILERATPNELVQSFCILVGDNEMVTSSLKSDEEILVEYNEIEYPKILAILRQMRDIFNKIDKSISIPLANKINSDCKISLKLPIGYNVPFVALPNHG